MDFLEFSPYGNFLGESYNHIHGGSCQTQDGSSDETNQKKDKKIKKYIKKYEPIVENQVVYRYEDNPEEYKRLRK